MVDNLDKIVHSVVEREFRFISNCGCDGRGYPGKNILELWNERISCISRIKSLKNTFWSQNVDKTISELSLLILDPLIQDDTITVPIPWCHLFWSKVCKKCSKISKIAMIGLFLLINSCKLPIRDVYLNSTLNLVIPQYWYSSSSSSKTMEELSMEWQLCSK